ncbi:carboxypeptidase regulatory-like domain-containing protein [Bacteroidota bacterium]
MKKYNVITLLVISIISFSLFQFCSSDSGTDPGGGTNPPTSNYGIILGTVKTVYGSGLGGVTVSGGGRTTTTNDQGWFTLADLSANDRLQVTFTHDNYVTLQKIITVTVGESSYINAVLAARANPTTVSGTSGGQVTSNGATVTFPPNSFTGDGTVYADYFDPTSTNYNDVFPGTFEGIPASGGSALPIESFGFMDVELQNAAGAELALTGQVTLTIPIPFSLQATAPATIPMWYYDTQAGYWREDGTAVRVGNEYQGTVTHFTSWNWDRLYDVAYITGRVVDGDGNPIAGARVTADGVDYSGQSYRTTSSDGTFNIGVRINSTVTVKASKNGVTSSPMTVITPSGAGGTTDIGDIVLAPPQIIITLTWGSSPSDLDSHLLIPDYNGNTGGHVYFSFKGSATSYPYANLDTDDTSSYGPEVTTIFRKLPGTYTFFVHNWSGEASGPLVSSQAKVQVIAGGNLYNFNVPTSGNPESLNSWHVIDLSIDSNGNIGVNLVNEFKDRYDLLTPEAMSKISSDKK